MATTAKSWSRRTSLNRKIWSGFPSKTDRPKYKTFPWDFNRYIDIAVVVDDANVVALVVTLVVAVADVIATVTAVVIVNNVVLFLEWLYFFDFLLRWFSLTENNGTSIALLFYKVNFSTNETFYSTLYGLG